MRFNGTFIGVKTSKVRGLELDDIYMDEAWKNELVTRRLKSFPRTTFSTWHFSIDLYYTFHTIVYIEYQIWGQM
jgi:hypothetical protein